MRGSDRSAAQEAADAGAQDRHQHDAASRHYALLFAPPAQRTAAQALFALVDALMAIPDTVSEPHLASSKLAWWQTEIDRSYHGRPTHPLTTALMPHLAQHKVPERLLLALVEGADVKAGQDAYATYSDLARYCDLAGSALWEALAHFFGPVSPQTAAFASQLGQGLALARIVRDVGLDAHQGRIFLPVDELQRFGVDLEHILDGKHSDGLAQLLQLQTKRARGLFDQALQQLQAAGQSAQQKPGLIMMSIHRRLLDRIARRGFAVLHERIDLAPLHKFWLAWKMQALGRF